METGTSSALRFSGLATGLDTSALVSALLDFERRPLDLVQRRRSELEQQQQLFRDFNGLVLELRDAARAIDNQNPGLSGPTLDEEFLSFQASSSDASRITVEASGNASVGTTEVRVLELADVGRRISATYATDTDPVASSGDSLSIDYGGAASIDITVGGGGASLQDLRDAINSDVNNGGNVRADVLFDGTEYRLVISGRQTGAANDIDVTTDIDGGAFIDDTLTQNASDARIELLGVEVTRASNDITDVVPGVTLRLRGTTDALDPGDFVEIDVTRDDEAVAGRLEALAEAYNKVRDFVAAQSAFDQSTGRAGPLSGDATVRNIERQIQRLLGESFEFPGNPLTFLGEIGLSFDRDGRLSVDRERLAEALDQDPVFVRQLLAGDGTSDGAATALARALEPVTRTGDGTLAIRDQALDDRLEGVDRQIERFEARLVKREELLVQTFTRLESLVAGLNAQAGFLGSI